MSLRPPTHSTGHRACVRPTLNKMKAERMKALRKALLVSGTAAAVTVVKSTSLPTTESKPRPLLVVMFVHGYDVTVVWTIWHAYLRSLSI